MNFLAFLPILSLMMVVHELGHFVTARMAGITVQEFGIGLPPRLFGFKRNGIIYSINLIPFGAFVKMLGEEDPSAPGSFAGKARWVRAIVLAAGSGMNFALAILAFTLAFTVGFPTPDLEGPVRFANVVSGSPAEAAGLQPGDQVIAVNGVPVQGIEEFREKARGLQGSEVQLEILRNGERVTTSLVPRVDPPPDQGAMGVSLQVDAKIETYPLPEAFANGLEQTWRTVALTFSIPSLLIEGAITPDEARPIGLPGMAQLTAQAVDYVVDTGFWYPIFMLTGIFSTGLGVANLLPIPALDGGRLFFIGLEALRGRRISPEREAAVHFVGIVLLLSLMIIITVNDIRSPLPQIDWDFR